MLCKLSSKSCDGYSGGGGGSRSRSSGGKSSDSASLVVMIIGNGKNRNGADDRKIEDGKLVREETVMEANR